jgi:hypothetical protein
VPLYDPDPEPVQETNAHQPSGVTPMESAVPAGSQYAPTAGSVDPALLGLAAIVSRYWIPPPPCALP